MNSLTAHYRKYMAFQIYWVVGIVAAPFAVWALIIGKAETALPGAITVVIAIANAFTYVRDKSFICNPIILSALLIADNLLLVQLVGPPGIYWAYPTMLALYWVHERRVAIWFAAILLLIEIVCAGLLLNMDHVTRIAATLFSSAAFFHVAAGKLEEYYESIQQMTITDYLTGAYNRRYMDQRIDEMLERQKRHQVDAAIISVDVDFFKKINDNYGHSVGDEVLVNLVKLLKARVRKLDSVCRLGGEEFVIVLPDTTVEQAVNIGYELCQTVANTPLVEGHQVTISCGVGAIAPNDQRDNWLKRCDNALYNAKAQGRNCVVLAPVELAAA